MLSSTTRASFLKCAVSNRDSIHTFMGELLSLSLSLSVVGGRSPQLMSGILLGPEVATALIVIYSSFSR